MYRYRAQVTIGQRGSSVARLGFPVSSLRLSASRHSVPTVTAVLDTPTIFGDDPWQYSPTQEKLHWARLDLFRTGGDEPDQQRAIHLWVQEVEEQLTVQGRLTRFTCVSADWILAQQRTREDAGSLLPTTGTVLHYQTLAEWWGANIMSSPIVDRPHDSYRSNVLIETDLSHESPGAPYNMPTIGIDVGVSLWDIASQLAHHWQAWVDGSITPSDETEPAVGISSFEGPSGQGTDLRVSTGKVIEQKTRTNLEGWGESLKHVQRYWVRNSEGELEERQKSTVYWSGQRTDLSLVHEVETWGEARLPQAMQRRAERTSRRALLTTVQAPIDLNIWLNSGVVVTGDKLTQTSSRRADWPRWVGAIEIDLEEGLMTLELAEGDGSLFLTSWQDIETSTWASLPQASWNNFD